jgi:Icc-related predicted phosphoesterase
MNILYTTDLHGDTTKYSELVDMARSLGSDLVINGGDMLPKGNGPRDQGAFITTYLVEHFSYFENAAIPYLCCLGNDDMRIWDELFDATCGLFTGIYNIAQRKVSIDGVEFIGMNWVADYPFLLKDRCRRDTLDSILPPQLGPGLLSVPDGYQELEDWPAYVQKLPTLEQELARLPQPQFPRQAVYIMHMPPSDLGLDVCANGEAVGSKAIYNFLQTVQPRLSVHGHIHESPQMSGAWEGNIGHTLCIQPGQLDGFTYVLIDLKHMKAFRKVDS